MPTTPAPNGSTDTHDLDARALLCGGDPDERWPVPGDGAFEVAHTARLADSGLDALARRLIATKTLALGHLNNHQIGILWAKTGGSAGGKPRLVTVSLASPDLKHYSAQDDGAPIDAVVTLAANHLRNADATRWQVAAQLAHGLSRIGLKLLERTGEERLTLLAPDASFFRTEVAYFGPHTYDLKLAATTLRDSRQLAFGFAGEPLAIGGAP